MTRYSPAKYAHDNDVNRLATHPDRDFARVPVDIGETGFFVGHEFRYSRKLTIAATLWWRFTSPVPFIIREQSFFVTAGEYEFRAYRAADVTAGGTWGETVPSFGKNTSPERVEPFYNQQSVIETGGTVTIVNADNYSDFAGLKTSGGTGKQTTVGETANSERYLAAGSYYLQFLPIGGTATGAYNLVIEERPQ